MKTLLLIIMSVAVTFIAINAYRLFTGTRAKSDDRSDIRTKSKQYDDLSLENAKLDNTVKTQAKSIKELNAINVSQKTTIALINAKSNAKDDKIKQLAVRFVNLQAKYYKLKNRKVSKLNKISKKTKTKIYKKPAKSENKIRKEREYRKLASERSKIIRFLKKQYKSLKFTNGIIGKKERVKSVKKIKNIISIYKNKLIRIKYKMRILK